jgi:hypothetical protein
MFAHMNIETIDPDLRKGAIVEKGQLLGKAGCTWDGFRSQTHDPHLHTSFHRKKGNYWGETSDTFSSYPCLMQAYFNTYPDIILPVAGGYHFGIPRETVFLDGSLSTVRPGHTITSVQWKLSNGKTVNDSFAEISYPKPGLYSEPLIVRSDRDYEDHDYAQVRVYDPGYGQDIAWGWV